MVDHPGEEPAKIDRHLRELPSKERYLNISNRLAHSELGLNLLARSFTAFTSYSSESKEEGKRLFLILLQVKEVLNLRGCPLSNCQEQRRASEQLLSKNRTTGRLGKKTANIPSKAQTERENAEEAGF